MANSSVTGLMKATESLDYKDKHLPKYLAQLLSYREFNEERNLLIQTCYALAYYIPDISYSDL